MLITNGIMVARVAMQKIDYETLCIDEDISDLYFHDEPKILIAHEWNMVALVDDLNKYYTWINNWTEEREGRFMKWEWIGTLTWLRQHYKEL